MDTEKVKADFQFIGSNIEHINIHNDFFIFPPENELARNLDVEHEIKNVTMLEDNGIYVSTLTMYVSVLIKRSDQEEEGKKFECELVLNGVFTHSLGIGEIAFKDLLSLNGCSALYGIARSLIMSLSAQSARDAQVILPMVNFFKVKERKESENKKSPEAD